MKIAFITRSTLHTVHGGDTVQIMETAKRLRELGVDVHVHLTNESIPYDDYELLHFFNVTRPADILYHIKQSAKPFVVSPILVDHSEYDKRFRKGLSGLLLRSFSADGAEYIKVISRWLLGKDSLQSKNYIWLGQTKSIRKVLQRAALVLPNSEAEYRQLKKNYPIESPYKIVPNGVDLSLFNAGLPIEKEKDIVLCAARIEGRKNQLNLIKALNNTSFRLIIVGKSAPNQQSYYLECKKIAGSNIEFVDGISQEELVNYYRKANIHVLPSWFESCGLSSLEAAAMHCNSVITDKGFTRDYFGDDAFYCDPADPSSIYKAIELAAKTTFPERLQEKIRTQYTWQQAAAATLAAYKTILPA